MLKNVTKRTKFSLLIIGLIFTGVLGTLVFFDSDSTEAAADFTYIVNVAGGDDANPGDSICWTGGAPGDCSFEAAIDEANADGGTTEIRFDSYGLDDYTVLHGLTITQPVIIIGPGAENLTIDMGSAGGETLGLESGAVGSSISSLTFEDCFSDACIWGEEASNITITDVVVDEPIRPGPNNWSISDSTFYIYEGGGIPDGDYAINNLTVNNNIFDCEDRDFGEESSVIDLSSEGYLMTNIEITDNEFTSCGDQMHVISLAGSNNSITGNTINSFEENAIHIEQFGDDINVSNNTISGLKGTAIEFLLTGDSISNIDINNNNISSEGIGIDLNIDVDSMEIEDLDINNNIITTTGDSGYGVAIYTNEEEDSFSIVNALIGNNQVESEEHSIFMSSLNENTSNIVISDNTLSSGDDNLQLAYIDGDIVTVDNNIIENGTTSGLTIINSEASFDITDNTIRNNTQEGIVICSTETTYPSGVNIINNTISGNTGYGLEICGGTNVNIEDNFFTNGEDNAIAIDAGDGFEINNNTFSGNTGDLLAHTGNPSNINFTENTLSNNPEDAYASVMFYGGGENNTVSNNSFSDIPGNVIATLMSEYPITSYNNTFDNCADTTATGFFVAPFSITYNSETYDDGTGGDGSLWFYSGDKLYEIGPTTDATSVTDGVNNFHLALVESDTSGGHIITSILFVRDDFASNEEEFIAALTIELGVGPGDTSIDYWQDDIWIANGATSDYTWNEVGDDISTSTAPDLYYANDEYLNFVYSLVTDDNIISNETITNSGQGFKFHGNNNYVIDSSIDTANSSLVSSNTVTNYLDNTSFNDHDVRYGTIKVNYDARIHLVDDEGNNLENATVSASYDPTFDMGTTDEDGVTSYISLDAATITSSGMTENQYTITATHNEETKTIFSTVDGVDQEIDFNFTTANTIADISGYVKQDETGLESIELHLYDTDDNLLNIIQTNTQGYYMFSNLEAGVYEIILQPASLPDLTGYTLSETNPRLVSLSGVDAEVDFNYSSSPVVNENTNRNTNQPYVNYNYNINTNLNTNNNTNFQVNTNSSNSSNTNSNINLNLDSLVVNNVNLSDGEKAPVIEQNLGEDLFLEGKTTPNTRVVITIVTEDGEEIQIETMSDSEGNWEIIFDKDKLPAGDHTIYIQTELNGQLSEMVELAKLVISGDKKISTTWLVVVTISVLFIIIIIILILLYVKKRNKKDQA